MATMRVAQIPKAGGDFEIVERPIPVPRPGTSGSVSRRAASVTAMSWPRTAAGRASCTRACRAMKSPG
jgi:hypothetical protein